MGLLAPTLLEDVREAVRQYGVVMWLDELARGEKERGFAVVEAFLRDHPEQAAEIEEKEEKRHARKAKAADDAAHAPSTDEDESQAQLALDGADA